MALFDWFRGHKTEDVPGELPWERHPSIFEHLKAHFRPGQIGLTEGGGDLPDEKRLNEGSQIRWAAGARDGVGTHHMGTGDSDQQVGKLLDLVAAYSAAPSVKNKLAVYDFILHNDALVWVDQFLEVVGDRSDLNHDRLYALAKSLATESPDREPVKFGISLLGRYRQTDDLQILRVLGRHDEFTLYCAVALSNIGDAPEAELWQLAKHVKGWGRIHAVERLSETENPEIKDWLLREGFKNSVLYEYLAHVCATTGDLPGALESGTLDDELLTSAAELIHALLIGGPAQDIDDYEDGAAVVEQFLVHMENRGSSLTQFLAVTAIKNFLADDKADWEARKERGWTSEFREQMRQQCEAIIDRPEWRQRVLNGLEQSDDRLFGEANSAATELKIETWRYHWDRLHAAPKNSGRWYYVMTQCDDARIQSAITLAERELPLDSIASGPADEIGFGPGFEGHNCLDCILQELGRFPGYGSKLIEVGLRSPSIRNRHMALGALSDWHRDKWPEGMDRLLNEARVKEPDDDVRKRIGEVLAGTVLE